MDYRNFEAVQPTIYGQPITAELIKEKSCGYGSLNPEFFFVSEQYESGYGGLNAMFSSLDSVTFFKWNLDSASINIEDCYFTCGIKPFLQTEDQMHMMLKLEIETLKPKIVVALGRRAEKMLLKVKDISSGLRWFEVLPHPSFWTMFHEGYEQEYVALLKNLKRKVHSTTVV